MSMNTIRDSDYQFIRNLVYEQSRISLGNDKKELVQARVNKRLRQLQIGTYSEYCRFLKAPEGKDELDSLVDVLTTNFTSFFRENRHFEFLRDSVLSKCTASNNGSRSKSFRIWSAACSTGEEPYTIAIVLAEFFSKLDGWDWQLDATDISSRVLAKAQLGVYDAERVTLPDRTCLRRYFQRGVRANEGSYRIKNDLKARIHFQQINLFQPDYPIDFELDAIFCRNVMIYFDQPTQELLVNRLTEYLKPGGHLFVGHSESFIGIKHSLRGLVPSVYQRPE